MRPLRWTVQRLAAAATAITALLSATPALAADADAGESDAVDVVLRDPPPTHRTVLLEANPLSLVTISRFSANIVVAPSEHHALVLSPYAAWPSTNPIAVYSNDGSQYWTLPHQTFDSVGLELGYRYYFGQGGPRGLFLGPSLIGAAVFGKAQDGAATNFANLGIAADVGYQMLVADRLSLSAGIGLQYTFSTASIPSQQFPAEIYVNDGLRPRFLLSIGWAF